MREEIHFCISFIISMFIALIMFCARYTLVLCVFPLILLDIMNIRVPYKIIEFSDHSTKILVEDLVGLQFTIVPLYNLSITLVALLAAPFMFALQFVAALIILPILFLNILDLEIQLPRFIDRSAAALMTIAGIQYI